jgi:AcrR family transcriptional regulator
VSVPSRGKPAASSRATSRSIKSRLTEALSTLTSATPPASGRITVSSLCRVASVSRNTVYRYYPDVAEAARRLSRRRGARRRAVQRNTLKALRSELAVLRVQLAKLATLADHYHTEAEELRAQLARRDRDLATRRGHARPTVVRIHRSTVPAPDSGAPGLIRAPPARS